MSGNRIQYLDGLRGLAIALVVPGHYIGKTYSQYLPYGDRFSSFPVFDRGGIGVQLFFMISGFVILMSLDRCKTAGEFVFRRWFRLFPSMLSATVIILTLSMVIGTYYPSGPLGLPDAIPGLTFIHPSLLHTFLRVHWRSVDDVFWTLYVEVAFYLIISFFYYRFGTRVAVSAILVLWLFAMWVGIGPASGLPDPGGRTIAERMLDPVEWLGFRFYGWFLCGCLFYKYHQSHETRFFAIATIVGLIAAQTEKSVVPVDGIGRCYLYGCALLFALAQCHALTQKIFASRFFTFIGKISYPLYLVHCKLGVALIFVAAMYLERDLHFLLPVVMTLFMMGVAWFIDRFMDPVIRNGINAVRHWTRSRQRALPEGS